MRTIVIAAMLGASSIPAHAEEPPISSGNGLYAECTSTSTFKLGGCYGYISGVGDALGGRAFGSVFCPPPDVTYEQAIDIVKAGLTNHPEERQEHSIMLIMKYLGAAWPCQDRKK